MNQEDVYDDSDNEQKVQDYNGDKSNNSNVKKRIKYIILIGSLAVVVGLILFVLFLLNHPIVDESNGNEPLRVQRLIAGDINYT